MTESIGKRRVRRTVGVPVSGAVPAPAVPPELLAWQAIPEGIRPVAPDYPVRTKDKVAIVGFAEGHRNLTPFDDPDFEIWGLNRLHTAMAGNRWTRWFEIHSIPDTYLGAKGQPVDKDHLEFLRTFAGPVYIRPQDMGTIQCPSAVPYALNAVLRDFTLPADRPYFTNSISYEIAYAIAMGFKEIHLYGVDMAQDGIVVQTAEYRAQRPSCEFFLGIASGRGIKVVLPPGSDLLIADHLYGFSDGSTMFRKRTARIAELNKRKEGVKQQLGQLEAQRAAMDRQYWDQKIQLVAAVNQMDGAAQECIYEMNQLSSPTST